MKISELNYTNQELEDLVKLQFEDTYKTFLEGMYKNGYPAVCEIHNLYEDKDKKNHNCIACNLADATVTINKFLLLRSAFDNIRDFYSTYIILLYLLVERAETIFGIIELHKGYRDENFTTFALIRKWANFIKHPKAFMLVHHPEYTFTGSPKIVAIKKLENLTVIDYKFIQTYYSNNNKNGELYEKLENKENVLVVFPEPNYLMIHLSAEIKKVINLLEKNEVYREILNTRATFYDFFVQNDNEP